MILRGAHNKFSKVGQEEILNRLQYIEEARFEEKAEIARNLKKMGLEITQIVQATGLSYTVIEQLN